MATKEELLWFHTEEYIKSIEELSNSGGGVAGPETQLGQGSYEIALYAVGGCIAAVDAVWKGTVSNAYCLVRPPGHHAERDKAMGFCVFNNVAIAAMYAKKVLGIQKIAIVDWDVHHGNGTQQAFYDDNSVLFISMHQDNLYPLKSGSIKEIGQGKGEGYNINVPLPPGTGVGGYEAAWKRVVMPALEGFQPEIILVSSGFDAAAFDPLSHMMLTAETFRFFTEQLLTVKSCKGRIVLCHEGGYSPEHVPFCGVATIEALSGHKMELMDPFTAEILAFSYQELQPHQDKVITLAEKIVQDHIINPKKGEPLIETTLRDRKGVDNKINGGQEYKL